MTARRTSANAASKVRFPRAVVALIAVAVTSQGLSPVSAVAAGPHGMGQGAGPVEIIPFEVETSDGVVLRGHVHKPAGQKNLGTVLSFSPYWNSAFYGFSDGSFPDPTWFSDPHSFPEAGFAYAAVNVRGTGRSGGCLQYGNKRDSQDAYAVIEELAAQPWSNGKVGMFGLSYDALMQYAAMAARPPSLKAVIPMSGWADFWSWFTYNGAASYFFYFLPAWRGLFSPGGSTDSITRTHTCGDLMAQDMEATGEMIKTGDRTRFSEERDLRSRLRASDVPAFLVNGTPLRDNRDFADIWKHLDPSTTRLLVGQWGHEYPIDAPTDFMTSAIAWFDHYLRGGPAVVRPGVVEFQDDAMEWHRSTSWPPDKLASPRLFLSDRRLVTSRRRVEPSSATFETTHSDPGRVCGPDQGPQTHALYASEPANKAFVVAGSFRLKAELTSSLPGGNFAAILYKTFGDGSCDDVAANGVPVGRIHLDLRHWKTPGRGQDFPVGRGEIVSLESDPVASKIHAGERLVLAVGGGSDWLLPDPMQPTFTVRTGRGIAAWLQLPVVAGRM